MKNILKQLASTVMTLAIIMVLIPSCNKELNDIGGTPAITPNVISTNRAIADTLNTAARANDSLYYKLIVRGGMLNTLNNKNVNYTLFVPTNQAMRVFINAISGGLVPLAAPDAIFAGFINANIPVASAAGIVTYNTIPQALPSASIPSTFPNFPYPTLLNPAPALSAFLRLNVYPSSRNGFWVNNVPLVSVDNMAANGIIHETGSVLTPPQQYLWDRINVDTTLTYLKAAVLRADSGVAVTGAGSLQGALLNIGANLTVYAPVDVAFRATLTGAIAQALIAQGVPPATALAQATFLASTPAVFSNPALFGALSAQTIKGIVVYHLMGVRAFNNNLPTTQANFPTLLNGAIAQHPGIGLRATFTGMFVSAATVKGLGNAAAADIAINPRPAPNGSSDQNYLNGVLHKINQVLLPQ